MSVEELYPLPSRYVLQNELPSGLLGSTALFQDSESEHFYVCKSILKDRIGGKDKIQRFKERLDHIKAVNNKLILPYKEIIETDERLLLIRHYIPDPPITELIENKSQDHDHKMFKMWKLVYKCFRDLHAHHIFPNIIRPNNIFILKESAILVTDLYPLCKDSEEIIHSPTPFDIAFIAPEFFSLDKKPDLSADLWSLGVLLVFMLTHELPWATRNIFTLLKQINANEISLKDDLPEFGKRLSKILLQIDPTKRKDEMLQLEHKKTDRIDLKDIGNVQTGKFASDLVLNNKGEVLKTQRRFVTNGFLVVKNSNKGNTSRAIVNNKNQKHNNSYHAIGTHQLPIRVRAVPSVNNIQVLDKPYKGITDY